METEVKRGDLVKHKSEQRITMVVAYFESGGIYCRYYNVITGLFATNLFNREELIKVEL